MLSIFIYIFCCTQSKVNFFLCKAWKNTKGTSATPTRFPTSTTIYERIRFFSLATNTQMKEITEYRGQAKFGSLSHLCPHGKIAVPKHVFM